jgi:hypothetical protein
MTGGTALNSKAVTYGILAVIGIAALYFLGKKLISAAGSGVAAVGTALNPTSDQNLAYKGVNAVGAAVSGDQSWSLGGFIYDLVHPAYDPNAAGVDTNTPNVGNSTIATSPVRQSPAILPYSYKQAVIDTPALLGTDALFTPSYLTGGSSGSFAESGVPGTGAQDPYADTAGKSVATVGYPSLSLQ